MKQYETEQLRQLVERVYRDGVRVPAPSPPADVHYRDLDTDSFRTIPGVQFQRQYRLCLLSLEMTLHGYAIRHRFNAGDGMEIAFSTHPPAHWRLLARPSQSIKLIIEAGPDGTSVSVGNSDAGCTPAPATSHMLVRLDQALQERLLQGPGIAPPARSMAARVLAWLDRCIDFAKR